MVRLVSCMTSPMKAHKDFPFVFSISTFSNALTGQQMENWVECKSNSVINKNWHLVHSNNYSVMENFTQHKIKNDFINQSRYFVTYDYNKFNK